MKTKIISFFAALIFFTTNSFAQDVVTGKWDGSLSVMGTTLKIIVNFKTEGDSVKGTIDIPEQSAKNLPLINIVYNTPKIKFELNTGQGNAMFDGEQKGDAISGVYSQSGMTGEFTIRRGVKTEVGKIEIETKVKPPYKIESVSFVNGENSFAGTLTIPEYPGKHPAVVMITGSGPQNRDEEIVGFKIFGIIADHLTRNGIAVLRYDDRGVGESKGKSVSESTTEEFSGDVIEAVKYLRTRTDINTSQIGLMGHSEGGIIAPMCAVKDKNIAFIILMAGTGVSGKEIILEQSKLIQKANGASDEEIMKSNEILSEILLVAEKTTPGQGSEENWNIVKEKIKKEIIAEIDKQSDEEKKGIADKETYAENMANGQLAQMKSAWMKYFLSYNPAPTLEKVTCPVLMLFGSLDLQVPPSLNEKPMTDALKKAGNKDVTVKLFPKANHLFQEATKGSPSEYATLKKEFIPGFLDFVSAWILKRVNLPR